MHCVLCLLNKEDKIEEKKTTSYKTNLLCRVYEKNTQSNSTMQRSEVFLLLCLSKNSKPSIIVKDNVEFLELQNFYATYILTRSKCGNSRDAPTSSIKKKCSLYSNVLCKKSQWTPCLGPVYSRTEGDLVFLYT